MTGPQVAVHAHFYQPPRHDPFTGQVPVDPSTAPARDWNSRITDECYAPNAAHGNLRRIGWDLGPTLGNWLATERPEVHDAIAASVDQANLLAVGYHHAILPLASARDRRTEIRWGIRDAELRFGLRPTGFWLPETAVDLATLRACAEEGVRWTILAPWQAAKQPLETRRPYRVALGDGQGMTVVFYDGVLSAALSFEPAATMDADRFARERLLPRLAQPMPGRAAPLVVLASDGELYGHHQPFRDLFLARLTDPAAGHGFAVTPLGAALAARRGRLSTVGIHERTSWSCHHGVARWCAECPDARDGRWKGPLRAALDRLAGAVDALGEEHARAAGFDLWAARDRYVDVASGFLDEGRFLADLPRAMGSRPTRDARVLLRAARSRLAMFASDAWFWDDPARPETLNGLRFAAHAARLMDGAFDSALERRLVEDLAVLRSPSSGADGAALYRRALDAVGQPAELAA